jgi:DNA-binding CsgD family transcriptional regulator
MTVETSQQPQLTEREKEVARLITLDLTYQEIADQLSISTPGQGSVSRFGI